MAAEQQADSADYAVALNELAQLKLSEGKTQEAQELFRQALGVQERLTAAGAGAPAAGGAEEGEGASEDDDWETRWDAGGISEADLIPKQPAPREEERWGGSGGGGGGARRGAAAGYRAPAGAGSSGGGGAAAKRAAAAAAAAPADGDGASGGGSGSSKAGAAGAPAAGAGGEVPFGGLHILELADLTTSVKTTQLEQLLARLLPKPEVPPVVKWVDDYRALALFANPRAAQAALQAAGAAPDATCGARVRAWCDASQLSRTVPAAELQPPKPRPLTTATVARRLIGGALNMRLRDREEEKVLAAARRSLKAAEAQRREKLDEAWGDE